MKPSLKRALVYAAAMLAGYGLGFYDGAIPENSLLLGPVLVGGVFGAVVIGKIGAWFWQQLRRAHGGGSSSSGPNGPGVREPRPPGGRPPVLSAQQSLG